MEFLRKLLLETSVTKYVISRNKGYFKMNNFRINEYRVKVNKYVLSLKKKL